MKIGILSRNATLYSTRRLARAAWTRGHQVRVLDTTNLTVHVGTNGDGPLETKLLEPGALGLPRAIQLPHLDAIIPRIGTSVTYYGLAVIRQFESSGIVTTASSQALPSRGTSCKACNSWPRQGCPFRAQRLSPGRRRSMPRFMQSAGCRLW
ncbi:MAG: hypothetical protein R3C44_13570 [Chloroflexota bacterium]